MWSGHHLHELITWILDTALDWRHREEDVSLSTMTVHQPIISRRHSRLSWTPGGISRLFGNPSGPPAAPDLPVGFRQCNLGRSRCRIPPSRLWPCCCPVALGDMQKTMVSLLFNHLDGEYLSRACPWCPLARRSRVSPVQQATYGCISRSVAPVPLGNHP